MIEQNYRLPTSLEKQIFARFLEINLHGRDSLAQQLERVLVRQIDEEGSLSFKVTTEARIDLPDGVAVEARYSDSEGVDPWEPNVNLLLHIANGLPRVLEIYKDDGSKIRRPPDPKELQLFSRYKIT